MRGETLSPVPHFCKDSRSGAHGYPAARTSPAADTSSAVPAFPARRLIPLDLLRNGQGPARMMFIFLVALFFFLSVAMVRLYVGSLPLRSFVSIAIFGLLILASGRMIKQGFRDVAPGVFIILYAAVLGLAVSLFAGDTLAETSRQILEIHIQALIGLLCGYALIHTIGARALVIAFVSVVCLSGLVATLQAAGVGAAWELRDFLQSLQSVGETNSLYLDSRMRAMGLSYSPVHLGTQLCLAFAAVYVYQHRTGYIARNGHGFLIALFCLFFFLSAVSGNRSPILGFVIFAALFGLMRWPKRTLLSGLFIFPVLLTLWLEMDAILAYLASSDIRAFRVGDKSSEGREALRAFGWLLLSDRPLGYGLGFSSLDYAAHYVNQLSNYENYASVFNNAVHNCYLNILLKHGAFILLVLPYLLVAIRRNAVLALGFLPYAIHVFYHNDGPLQGDFMVWYFLPLFVLGVKEAVENNKTTDVSPRPFLSRAR